MCRFLLYSSKDVKPVSNILIDFAKMCKDSKNEQKDGWGAMYRSGDELILQKSLNPIWEDANKVEIPDTNFLLLHARWGHGAWTLGDIKNNQPFYKDEYLFAFNGNLKRVKIEIPGRIGAEKILNLLLRETGSSSPEEGMTKAVQIMKEKAQIIKAINFLFLKGSTCYAHSYYTIDPDYFDLRLWEDKDSWIISSYPLDGRGFIKMPTDQVIPKQMHNDISGLPIIENPF